MFVGDATKALLHLREREPQARLVMRQRWEELLFLHWPVPPALIEKTLPHGLHTDTFEGRGWIGIVPFRMCGVRPIGLPSVPGVSNFLELNLRTYVVDEEGRPGVWFYSLDANQRLAVKVARTCFSLPYHYARMAFTTDGPLRKFDSTRPGVTELPCHYAWTPTGSLGPAREGSLDFFLVERYALFAHARGGELFLGRVQHEPYQIRTAQVTAFDTHLFALNDLPAPNGPPPHVCYSPGVDVSIFAPRSLEKVEAFALAPEAAG